MERKCFTLAHTHCDHLVSKPMGGMDQVPRVRKKDKCVYPFAVPQRAVAIHSVAEGAKFHSFVWCVTRVKGKPSCISCNNPNVILRMFHQLPVAGCGILVRDI